MHTFNDLYVNLLTWEKSGQVCFCNFLCIMVIVQKLWQKSPYLKRRFPWFDHYHCSVSSFVFVLKACKTFLKEISINLICLLCFDTADINATETNCHNFNCRLVSLEICLIALSEQSYSRVADKADRSLQKNCWSLFGQVSGMCRGHKRR